MIENKQPVGMNNYQELSSMINVISSETELSTTVNSLVCCSQLKIEKATKNREFTISFHYFSYIVNEKEKQPIKSFVEDFYF